MKAKLIVDCQVTPGADALADVVVKDDGKRWYLAGAVIEHERAHRLVQMGVAEPADAECTLACCMTTEQMKKAQLHQEMVAKGILIEDYQRYLDGEILGCDEDGNDIPGPHWPEAEDEDEDEPDYLIEEDDCDEQP